MDIILDESVKRKKRRKKVILSSLGVIAIVLISIAVAKRPPAAQPVDAGQVWPDTVKRGSMLRQVRGLGTLVPIPDDIRIISAETDVRVERIIELPGATVRPDSIIMELSNPQVQQEVIAADADLKSAQAEYHNTETKVNGDLLNIKAEAATVEADYENAKRAADANKELVKIGVMADSTLKDSLSKERELSTRFKIEQERIAEATKAVETQLAVQKANIANKQALVDLKHRQMDALKVHAGIAGQLSEVPVQMGQRVVQGTILAKVVQPEHLKAELKIPETQAKDILSGQLAEVDTHNGVVSGKVSRIDPSVQNGTVTVDVKLDGAPPKGSRPDLSVDGTITLERLDNVLYIGRPAFGQEKSTVEMFRVDPDGNGASKIKVELGRSSVTTQEIIRGLKEGETVILSDMSRYESADRIRLVH